MAQIHCDEAYYPSATTYDAFRFSRAYEKSNGITSKVNGSTAEQSDPPTKFQEREDLADRKHQQQQRIPLTRGGDTFLAFGTGKHSCPGRFFAAHEMKLMLAYLVQHYDVEYMPKRPAQSHFMEVKMPAKSTIIRIRKRQS